MLLCVLGFVYTFMVYASVPMDFHLLQKFMSQLEHKSHGYTKLLSYDAFGEVYGLIMTLCYF